MTFDIKHILFFGLALGMTSCVETMEDGDRSTGYLGVPVLETDIQVEEFGATKAAPALPTLSVPDASTLHFKVTGSDNEVKWDQKGLWSTALQMPVGAYTIEVNYGSNTFGAPYYAGTCTGTISAVTEAVPAIGLRLCNSLLAVVLADDFTQHFIPSEGNCVTISSTSGSTSTTLGNYVFVPAGETFTIQVAGKSSTNEDKTLSWTLSQLSAATATFVTCSLTTTNAPAITMSEIPVADAWGNTAYVPLATTANISDANVAKMKYYASSNNWTDSVEGTLEGSSVKFTGLTPGATYKVRATIGALYSNEVSMTMSTSALTMKNKAAHTYTSSELDGTDFAASFSVLEKFGVTAASLSLCKTDGTVLRTTTLTGTTADWTSDGSTLTGSGTWPFLPGGNYSLKGTATQNGSTVTLAELPITVPATPDFTVSVTGKTTLDYSKTDINTANSKVAETIYEVGYSVSGISAALLNNSNYGLSCQYAINGNNVTSTDGTITGCAWGENNLTAAVSFAGKSITSSAHTCHITGLPYNATPPTNTGAHPWSGDANAWNSEYVRLYRQTIKQSFNIVSDINVNVYFNAQLISRASNTYFYVYAGGVELFNDTYYKFGGGTKTDSGTYGGMLTKANNTVEVKGDTGLTPSGENHTKVYQVSVSYR